jgi:hypothetical protein
MSTALLKPSAFCISRFAVTDATERQIGCLIFLGTP